MIVLLPYDVAHGYDSLAILTVKRRYDDNLGLRETTEAFDHILRGQVGSAKHEAILASPEYARLVEVNQTIFDIFERLHKEGEWLGGMTETDRLNGVDRHHAKRVLQARWFPSSPLTEQKLGYTQS